MTENIDPRAPVREEMEWNEILAERIKDLGKFVDCADRNANLALDRLAAIENRLTAIEEFLEIGWRANPMEANTLNNRITYFLNVTIAALNDNIQGASDRLEAPLSARIEWLEERMQDLEAAQKKTA